MYQPHSRSAMLALLLLSSAASLVLITAIDDAAYRVLVRYATAFTWVAEARVTSFVACLALYVAAAHLDAARSRQLRVPFPWRTVLAIAGLWVLGTVVADFVIRVFLPALPRRVDIAAFLVFGLGAEELLFRGALFRLTERATARSVAPIVWTAVLFSLQHLQYHQFHFTREAVMQMSYTLPMGLILGYLRSATQRMWPSVGLHVLTNAIALIRIAA